jgi:hypothetical protein
VTRTVHDYLRERLLSGVHDAPPVNLAEVARTQWSYEFERLMRARLLMGYFRYGAIGSVKPYDNISSAMRRLRLYLETGNQENLVDAANLCMVEHMWPGSHSNPWFGATDDGEHTERR